MTGLCNVSFCIGPLVTVLIENSIDTDTDVWSYRALFVAQWDFGATAIFIAPFMPESPWRLVTKGREEDPAHALSRLGHTDISVEKHLAAMKVTNDAALCETEGATYAECFQAMCGVAFIGSHTAYYMELAGISTHTTLQVYCGAQALSLSGNIIAFWLYDRLGRRPLILYGFGSMTVLLMIIGGLDTMTINESAILATVSFMGFYAFLYNLAIGTVAWAIIGETPTARLQTKTIAISGIVQQGLQTMCQFVLSYIFNPNEANLGAKTAFIFGGCSIICWIYLFFYQPETANRTFEEIDEMFFKHVSNRKFKNYKTNAEMKGEEASKVKRDIQHLEMVE